LARNWSDSDIVYNGYIMDEHEVEDAMYEIYNEWLKEENLPFLTDDKENERFAEFMLDNADRVEEFCQDAIDCDIAKRVDTNSFGRVFNPFDSVDGYTITYRTL
jgi:hypothetical protein